MTESTPTQTIISMPARPFSETFTSGVPPFETIPEGLRVPIGTEPAQTLVTKYVGDDSSQAWFWAEQWQAGEREAQLDIAGRRGDFFGSSDEFLESL